MVQRIPHADYGGDSGRLPIDLHEEAAHYVAHYMAGQLYKHDDISIAQIYMNEFFEWMERLAESGRKADGRNAGSGGWTSVKGY